MNINISLFSDYTCSVARESTLDDVALMIACDNRLQSLTEAYRSTGTKTFKESCPMFAVACTFNGGKARRNVSALTGLAIVDIDHVEEADIGFMKEKAAADPHVVLSYVTISGKGLRIIFSYELCNEMTLDEQCRYYSKVFTVGNAYYAELLGAECDLQCKNITRLSGMAYDPDLCYNPATVPFTRAFIDSRWNERVENERRRKRCCREIRRVRELYDKTLCKELENEGAVFSPGTHNDYIMRLGYKLNQFGISLDVAVEWAKDKVKDYDDIEQVFRSCYRNTEDFATRGGKKRNYMYDNTDRKSLATVNDIRNFLDKIVKLRFNTLTKRVEYHCDNINDCSEEWQPLSDRIVNSLWTMMSQDYVVNINDIYRVIGSDYVAEYDPFRDYIDSLPEWHEGDTDYISLLADTVTVKGDDAVSSDMWQRCLTKWLVAMVASWLSPSVVNNVILVLVGPQGMYKTTWFNFLLPPPLRKYFYTKTNSRRMSRDDLLTLTEYALVCCEELDSMNTSEYNQLKAAVTMPTVDERAAYARYKDHLAHIASFCGTGNNTQFLSDPTGNRRWLPFEVKHIKSPRDNPLPYEGIYSQVAYLLNKGYRYWFSQEEIAELAGHNTAFETPRLESELVMLYFRHPVEPEHGEFMTAGRVLQIIGGGISQKLNPVMIGRALSEQGFRKGRYKGVRGYIVCQRSADEIAAAIKTMAIEADTLQDGKMAT